MNEQDTQPIHDRSTSKAHLVAKLIRYRNLFLSKWWIPCLAIAIGLGVETWISRIEPSSFVSIGRMIVSIKLAIPEGSVYTEELSNFLGTQAALMQSGVVINRAHARVVAQKPDQVMQPVALKVSVLPKTTIFVLQGTGSEPRYTQAFVQACMEHYFTLKNDSQIQTSDTAIAR